MKMRNATRMMNPKMIDANAFLMNPAKMYVMNEMIATEIAYGSCVATWFTWLH